MIVDLRHMYNETRLRLFAWLGVSDIERLTILECPVIFINPCKELCDDQESV